MYALKFISGKYQGGEFPLKDNHQIVIGRSSELDMVLVEDMVSRKHAKISSQDGKLFIEDLGSTNGTFVNGEKIKQARLKEGDRILVGTSILKVIPVSANSPLGLDDQVTAKRRLQEAAEASAAKATRTSSMTGKLEEVPLPDLLQLFGTSKKNGVLAVRSKQGQARIYLRAGKIYYAVIDEDHDVGPRKSFFRLLRWESGDFELLAPDTKSFEGELDDSTEALLMEGLRQLDEMRRLEKEGPSLSGGLSLAIPMNPPLRELAPAQLDLLQLVHNHGSMQAVLDRSAGTDLEVATLVHELVKKGYLQSA